MWILVTITKLSTLRDRKTKVDDHDSWLSGAGIYIYIYIYIYSSWFANNMWLMILYSRITCWELHTKLLFHVGPL